MPAGRPRTVTPDAETCKELGEDLVRWATEETKEFRCLLQQWYSIKMGILRKDWKSLIQHPEFLPYYETAQAALSVRCVDGTMKEGFGQRYLRLYDRNLVEEENDKAKFDAELKKVEDNAQHKKIEFVVNYANDSEHPIKVLPQTVSTPDTSCSQ